MSRGKCDPMHGKCSQYSDSLCATCRAAIFAQLEKQGVDLHPKGCESIEGMPASVLRKPAEVHVLVTDILLHPARGHHNFLKRANRESLTAHTVPFLRDCKAKLDTMSSIPAPRNRSYATASAS